MRLAVAGVAALLAACNAVDIRYEHALQLVDPASMQLGGADSAVSIGLSKTQVDNDEVITVTVTNSGPRSASFPRRSAPCGRARARSC